MNKMKNFKRRFSLSVPRTETIEESLTEFTEQFNQLNNHRNEGEEPLGPCSGAGAAQDPLGWVKAPPSPLPSHPRGGVEGVCPFFRVVSPIVCPWGWVTPRH